MENILWIENLKKKVFVGYEDECDFAVQTITELYDISFKYRKNLG